MSYLALSDSFEYLCYGSTAIRNIHDLTVRRSILDVRRQIPTTIVDPRAVRVNMISVHPESSEYKRHLVNIFNI